MTDSEYDYDPRCGELAMAFLDNQPKEEQTPENRAELAQQIQDTVEQFLLGLDIEREAAQEAAQAAQEAAQAAQRDADEKKAG